MVYESLRKERTDVDLRSVVDSFLSSQARVDSDVCIMYLLMSRFRGYRNIHVTSPETILSACTAPNEKTHVYLHRKHVSSSQCMFASAVRQFRLVGAYFDRARLCSMSYTCRLRVLRKPRKRGETIKTMSGGIYCYPCQGFLRKDIDHFDQELQLGSLQFCIACRSERTLLVKPTNKTPRRLWVSSPRGLPASRTLLPY